MDRQRADGLLALRQGITFWEATFGDHTKPGEAGEGLTMLKFMTQSTEAHAAKMRQEHAQHEAAQGQRHADAAARQFSKYTGRLAAIERQAACDAASLVKLQARAFELAGE